MGRQMGGRRLQRFLDGFKVSPFHFLSIQVQFAAANISILKTQTRDGQLVPIKVVECTAPYSFGMLS